MSSSHSFSYSGNQNSSPSPGGGAPSPSVGSGFEQAADEALFLDAERQLVQAIARALVAVLRQAGDRAEAVRKHLDRPIDQVVHVLRSTARSRAPA